MVGANKILTVSYGTFSCTLEGFDEPFSTMKAIAEYFRDLAADDRYFGAEPPTPDAEMLSRIAEREIQRRVEAKISEHGVVLRQTEAAPQPAPVAIAAAAPVAAAVAEVAVPEPVAEPAAMAEEPEVEEPLAEVVAAAAEEDIAEEPFEAESVEAEAEEEPQPEPLAAAGADDSDDDYEIAFDTIMAEAAEAGPEAGEPQPVQIVFPEAAEEPAEPDSVAAKLARIRAVVDGVRNGAVASFADEEDEEAEAEALAAPVTEDFGFDLDSGEDAPELRAAEAARAAAREADAVAADEAAFDDEMAVAGAEAEAEAAEAEPETYEVAAAAAEAEAPEVEAEAAVTVAEDEYAYGDQDIDDADGDFDDDFEDDEPEAIAAAAPAGEAVPVAELEDAELLARLSELGMTSAPRPAEQAPAAAAAETDDEADDKDEDDRTDAAIAAMTAEEAEEPVAEPVHQPSLLQRARASVIRLSKVATILGHSNTEEPARDEIAAAEPEDAVDEIEALPEAAHEEDPDVSRLMDEAKSKLEGAESRRRFSAISHLKAAVAATLADRQMKPSETPAETKSEEDLGLYRDDLSKAVRPRRPTADAGSATPRPSLGMRLAPLVLVSEQRVDRPEGGAAEGVVIRPRRVASGNLAVLAEDDDDEVEDIAEVSPESASSFAEFAGRLGATTLTELLEAAAVYTASVEGRPHFSRPHLLRKVEFVSTRNYNREDGLRSFGTLLRQGKIQKISRGQFTVSGSSRFMSEARQVH